MSIKISNAEFIQRCVDKHGNRFDYSKTIYAGYYENISVICPLHGEFTVVSSLHFSKNGSCPGCKPQKYTTENFAIKARKVHGDKFTYNEVKIISTRTATQKVLVTCPVHGDFETTADIHINSGHGCDACAREAAALRQSETLEKFLEKANKIHGDSYDYSLVAINHQDKVKIKCNRCGNIFEQAPYVHTGVGCGCKICTASAGGYCDLFFENNPDMKTIPGVLYKIRMFNESESFIKIGITKNDVDTRYKGYRDYQYTIISEEYMTLFEAYTKEQALLEKYENIKHWPKIRFNGWTECFKENGFTTIEYTQE